MSGTTTTAAQGRFPAGWLLAASWGLPQAAVDALWRAGLLDRWEPGAPPPAPPSDSLFEDLLDRAPKGRLRALAAAVRDVDILDRLVSAHPEVAETAAANPYLGPATQAALASRKSTADAVAARIAAEQLLADHVAGASDDANWVAEHLGDAFCAVVCSDLLAGAHHGFLNDAESRVATAISSQVLLVGWGAAGAARRRTRAAIFDLLGRVHGLPDRVAVLGALLACDDGGCIDPGALEAVCAAIDSGMVTADAVTARLDTDAASWAPFLSQTAAELVPPADRHKVASQKGRSRREVRGGTATEADALALLGLGHVGTRMLLSTGQEVSDEDVAARLAGADIETVVDWAEGRLTHKPRPGDVIAHVASMSADELAALAVEVGRRPEPFEMCSELAVVAPGAANEPLGLASGRALRVHLQDRLGDDADAWDRLAATLAAGTEDSFMAIAASIR